VVTTNGNNHIILTYILSIGNCILFFIINIYILIHKIYLRFVLILVSFPPNGCHKWLTTRTCTARSTKWRVCRIRFWCRICEVYSQPYVYLRTYTTRAFRMSYGLMFRYRFQMQHDVKEIAVFGSASEGFSRKNIGCGIAESLERFEDVVSTALDHGIKVRGYISCVCGCPYDGAVSPQDVAKVVDIYNTYYTRV